MKPENMQPRVNQESSPNYFNVAQERRPITSSPEISQKVENSGVEQQQKSEASIDFSGADIASSLPAPVADNTSIVVTNTTSSSNPLIANDKDVIENEWVRAAKKIVSETRDDPHRQEEEVGKLQVDYMSKRYGEEIKRSE